MSVDEVFDQHRNLLFSLMDRVPKPRGSEPTDVDGFRPIIAVLEVYAADISDLDRILHQPTLEVL
jgi:hypothetical protein